MDDKAINLSELMVKAREGDLESQYKLGKCFMDGEIIAQDYNNAFKLFQESAEKGYPPSINSLGYCYLHGLGTNANKEEAISLFEKAASLNNVYALLNLGDFYWQGKIVPQDIKKAIKYYEQAGNLNDVEACSLLAEIYNDENGSMHNEKLAYTWYKKAAELGERVEEMRLMVNFPYGDPETADIRKQEKIRALETKAKDNDAAALYELSICYGNGDCVEEDEEEADKLLLQAAELGNADAQWEVASDFKKKENWEKAFYWFEKAANQDVISAQHELGLCYRDGDGTPCDFDKALYWLDKAAQNGDIDAECEEGDLYRLIKDDTEQAMIHYEKAAEGGSEKAQMALAYSYMFGIGVKENHKLAFKWYKEAATYSTKARYELGECYLHGIGVEKNTTEALKCFKWAAQGGNVNAKYQLGTFYRDGINLKKDVKKANELFVDAANGNNVDAKIELGKLYKEGKYLPQDYEKAFDLFSEAATAERASGKYELGLMYKEGVFVKPDMKEARRLLKMAADEHFPAACNALGEICLAEGTKESQNEAYKWFKKGEMGEGDGCIKSFCNLVKCTLHGWGCNQELMFHEEKLMAELLLNRNKIRESTDFWEIFLEVALLNSNELSVNQSLNIIKQLHRHNYPDDDNLVTLTFLFNIIEKIKKDLANIEVSDVDNILFDDKALFREQKNDQIKLAVDYCEKISKKLTDEMMQEMQLPSDKERPIINVE